MPDDLLLSLDENGSLVTVPPSDWLVCFVPGLKKQWWHKFVNGRHKHCFAMRPTGTGSWVLVEPWWTRLMVTVLPSTDAVRFLRWGAAGDMLRVREAVPGKANQLRGWSNCAVLMSFLVGRVSWTYTPHGLYRQLARETTARKVDVEDLVVEQFQTILDAGVRNVLSFAPRLSDMSIEQALTRLGRNIVTMLLAPHILDLCHTAILEADHFPRAARAYNEHGYRPLLTAVAAILCEAERRGEIHLTDSDCGARHFVAMLRGAIHLEAIMGLCPPPSSGEQERRVDAVVDMFLNGVGARVSEGQRVLDAAGCRRDVKEKPL